MVRRALKFAKTHMKKLLASLALSLVASSLHAAPFAIAVGNPAFDPFNYTVGANLSAQTSPQGLAWAAAGTSASHQPTINTGSLSWSGLAPSSGNSVAFGSTVAANGDSARMALGTFSSGVGFISGTVYYSMILEVNGLGTLPAGGAIVAGFNNQQGASSSQPGTIGSRLYMKLVSTDIYEFGLEVTGANPTYYSPATQYTVPETFFIVGSYTFSSVSPNDDSVSLWINPVSSTFGAVDPAAIPSPTLTVNASGTDVGLSRAIGTKYCCGRASRWIYLGGCHPAPIGNSQLLRFDRQPVRHLRRRCDSKRHCECHHPEYPVSEHGRDSNRHH